MVNRHYPIYGLVLTGGQSRRMKKDKARLKFHQHEQARHAYELLLKICEKVFISNRKEQKNIIGQKGLPQIHDLRKFQNMGPLSGILSAMSKFPNTSWLVLACDLPFVDEKTLKHLLRYRDATKIATSYRSRFNDLPEPLCTIYEPKAQKRILSFLKRDVICPRKILINCKTRLLKLKNKKALDNINTPKEYRQARAALRLKI
ncbi:MAG: NTP transferase domain-containing protein [Candidatus Omnitrophica bacterium]|nr:NTP transferase domain-containing protein [Candidatus Omnitrophota bacterium]